MTSIGDLCKCGDAAAPGREKCGGCIEDDRLERLESDKKTAQLTADYEAQIIESEEAA